MRRSLMAFLAALLAACGTSGVQVRTDQVEAIRSGRTTETEVRAALGPPTGVSTINGQRILVYSGFAYSTRPESFIPIVGPFVGGADVRSSYVAISIGPDGVVTDVRSHVSESGATTGAAAEQVPRTPNQPRY